MHVSVQLLKAMISIGVVGDYLRGHYLKLTLLNNGLFQLLPQPLNMLVMMENRKTLTVYAQV